MIGPDDPRHGTPRGHYAGCREACCRAARARYEKGGRLDRLHGGRAIPALGYQRRIKALVRLGWSYQDIADAMGWTHRNHVRRVVVGQKGKPTRWIERATAGAIGQVYERLCMTVPQGPYAHRTRLLAGRKGYPPPLAWDDIDNPDERPHGDTNPRHGDDIDPVAVARTLAGDIPRYTTVAEKRETVRLWLRQGRTLAELERYTGWNSRRYVELEAS